MQIHYMMNLSDLAEHMSRDLLEDAEVLAMRAMLVAEFDGFDTCDVPERRWEELVEIAAEARDLAWTRTDSDAGVRRAAAKADRDAGRDMSWARTDSDTAIRLCAALADRDAGRDMSWARTDSDTDIRFIAAWADYDAGRDVAWTRTDSDAGVRRAAASRQQ